MRIRELGNGRFGRLEIQAYRFVIGRRPHLDRNVAVELSGSACVNTTNTNRASRSGPTANLDSTPPCTLSLLSTAAAASARTHP